MRINKTTLITPFAALAVAVPGAFAADTGGAVSSAAPEPESVSCSKACADLEAARPGSTVRIYGRELKQVAEVVFMGGRGTDDDVVARPSKVRSRTVYVRVPEQAKGGPLTLVNRDGTASAPTPPIDIDHGPARIMAAGSVPAVDAKVEFRKAYFDGRRPAALNYLVKGDAPVSVTIALVRAGTETTVATWKPGVVEPGAAQNVRWDGIDANTGRSAARGRYEFRVFTGDASAKASQAPPRPTAARSFLFLDHQFPIRGAHDYGQGQAQFGAGRSGHSHQGQDVFAKCGTPLVAARGGRVKFAGSQSRAGNYIVINGAGTGLDYAYMHLAEPALFKKGATVRTGDPIGLVGDTGVAHGCHLHFELWSAPGWYTGGRPFDPLPDLRAWDSFS